MSIDWLSNSPLNPFYILVSGRRFRVQAAVDINESSNAVYKLNHRETPVWNRNIQSLTIEELNKLKIDTILMSPPCQPFTRQGKQLDVKDNRSEGFLSICQSIIRQLAPLKRILMENVKGFEESEAQKQFVGVLKESGFHYQEYLLNPIDCIGIPNSRTRYFCIARKDPFLFSGEDGQRIVYSILPESKLPRPVSEFVDPTDDKESYLIPKKDLLKNCWVFDMVTPESTSTNCFTKAYGHFARGTGSVFCPVGQEKIRAVFDQLRAKEDAPEHEKLQLLKELQLRYFTPREIERLMGFSSVAIKYPDYMTNRQKYKLLGNSLNVQVVAELIKIL